MTLIVLGQTGLIGNSLKKYHPNDSVDFSISKWDIDNFNTEVSCKDLALDAIDQADALIKELEK